MRPGSPWCSPASATSATDLERPPARRVIGDRGQTDGVDAPVTAFSHLQLRVRDVRASVDWYGAVLGAEVMSEHGDVVALRQRSARFVIVVSPGDPVVDRSPVDHLAFAVPDGPTLEAWADHLRDLGIDVPPVVDELGKPSLQLRDPDGNAVELVAPAPRA